MLARRHPPPHECCPTADEAAASTALALKRTGATATTATVAIAEAISRTILAAGRPMSIQTGWELLRLPEALALGLEQVVAGQPPGEAEEPRVGHHAM